MSWVFRTMTMLLALLWLPLATHCDWEHLEGLELFACCEPAGSASHQQDDCQTDLCASVESGFYKLEEGAIAVPNLAPFVACLQFDQPVVLDSFHPERVHFTFAPPELACSWHFIARAALPPRAPDLAS